VCTENRQIGSTDAGNVKKKGNRECKEKNARSEVGTATGKWERKLKKEEIKGQKILMHDRPTKGRSVCEGDGQEEMACRYKKYTYTVNSGSMER